MANGCVDARITRHDFDVKSTDEKLACIWDIVQPLQQDVRDLKKWATAKIFAGAMVGGALAMLVMYLFGVKAIGGG